MSGDTLALVVTALIGVGGFILQSKAAKAADETTFMAISEHVEPMPTWPHIRVRPHGSQAGLVPKMTPYVKYTPEDLAMLEADVEKRQLYIERYTDCIVPCLLDFGELVRRKWHLLEDTGSIFALARYCSQPHMVANRHLY